jgi:hypothetical protein
MFVGNFVQPRASDSMADLSGERFSLSRFNQLSLASTRFGGPIWPTASVVSFHDTVDASSTVLPFKILKLDLRNQRHQH